MERRLSSSRQQSSSLKGLRVVAVIDAVGSAPDVMATRGQSDMRGFGYPHDRLCVGSGARLESSVAVRLLIAEPRMLLAPARARSPRRPADGLSPP